MLVSLRRKYQDLLQPLSFASEGRSFRWHGAYEGACQKRSAWNRVCCWLKQSCLLLRVEPHEGHAYHTTKARYLLGAAGFEPDWVGGQGSVYLAFSVTSKDGRAIYVGFSNAGGVESTTIPSPPSGTAWHRVVDTGDPSQLTSIAAAYPHNPVYTAITAAVCACMLSDPADAWLAVVMLPWLAHLCCKMTLIMNGVYLQGWSRLGTQS